MQLIFASPTYGPIEPKALISQRVAIMHAGNNGNEWLGDASPNREGWETARNKVVDSVVNSEHPDDAMLFWCDSDVVLPGNAITRLCETAKGVNGEPRDFVTGIYFQRHPPHRPLISTFNGDSFNWVMKWPDNAIAPIDGCGFGCVLTSLGMLRKMEKDWFKYQKFSEDFDFCLKAKNLGFQLWVDTAVYCEHLMDPKGAGFEDFKREHPQFYAVNESEIGVNNGTECVGNQRNG